MRQSDQFSAPCSKPRALFERHLWARTSSVGTSGAASLGGGGSSLQVRLASGSSVRAGVPLVIVAGSAASQRDVIIASTGHDDGCFPPGCSR